MELIDMDKLKQYIDDCKCCEKCDKISFMCNDDCELPDFLTPQWERVLDEQPTVDAVPVGWIVWWLNRYPNMSDGSKSIVRMMMNDWKAEQEKQNE